LTAVGMMLCRGRRSSWKVRVSPMAGTATWRTCGWVGVEEQGVGGLVAGWWWGKGGTLGK